MYRMSPAPRKRSFDEYIRLCLERKNFHYFRCFLHYYEPALNRVTFSYCYRYEVMHLFPDVKQTIVLALLESLRRYKPDTGVPFLAFAKYKVRDDVRDFIRLNGGIFSIANSNHYRQLAKANALYYKGIDEGKPPIECKEEIASLMHIEYETVDALICEGMDFRSYKNKRPVFERALEDEHFSPIQAYEKGDRSADPDGLVPYLMAIRKIADTVEALPFKRRYVLYALAGIQCVYCGRICEKKTYHVLANEFERYDKRRMEAFARETQIKLHYMLPWWTQFVDKEEP